MLASDIVAIKSNKPGTTFTSNTVYGLKVNQNGNLEGTANIPTSEWTLGTKEKKYQYL